MNSILVIHPFDVTTGFLEDSYSDKNYTVLDDKFIGKSQLKKEIMNHDKIIIMGHGSEYGLLRPSNYTSLIIDPSLVWLLRQKEVFGIWCNADKFFDKYSLRGFCTGMIISEKKELKECSLEESLDSYIQESNLLFASSLRESFDSDNFLETFLNNYYLESNPIVNYNRIRIFKKE